MHNILKIHDIHVNQYYGCEAFVICLKLIEILKDALLYHGVDWFCPIWADSWQNQQNGMCTQQTLRSAWASIQSDQSLHCPHEESLGP